MSDDRTGLLRTAIVGCLLVGVGYVLYSQLSPTLRPLAVLIVAPPLVLLTIRWLVVRSATGDSS
ncbi:hypothetical protein C478_06875 [Natrinema thermotolerans DSM 11552]|nr:hypothetical protein C478_06875 [Natrinema thermotolerans DSM 11552]